MYERLTPLSLELSFHLLKNTPKGARLTVPGYIWLLLDRTDCNLQLVQFPLVPVMWNCQEKERNWKSLVVEILLLKVTVKSFCEKNLFKRCFTREFLSTCTSWSQWELQLFTTFPGQTLKCQNLLISALCGDCPPVTGWWRMHCSISESNCSLLWSLWHPCSSASARNTVYWSEQEGSTARIHKCEEAHPLRHVLSSLLYDFHEAQYNAFELRQHFTVCPLTWLKVWANKNGVRQFHRLMAPYPPYVLSDPYKQRIKPKQARYYMRLGQTKAALNNK